MSDLNKKLVVVGDGFCGKTALLYAFTQDKFDDNYEPTVFETVNVQVELDRRTVSTAWLLTCDRITLTLWDTAGQDDYDRLRPLSYPDTDVILLCYSINSLSTLKNITEKWVPELNHFCYGVPFVLVGNKMDLRQEAFSRSSQSSTTEDTSSTCSTPKPEEDGHTFDGPMVVWEEGQKIAKDIGAFAFHECSAKTRENVKDVFVSAIKASLKPRKVLDKKKRCRFL